MLVAVQNHVFQSAKPKRTQVTQFVGPFIVVQIVLIRAFKLYSQRDTALSCLLFENGQNLGANISQAKLLFIQAQLLSDLVLATLISMCVLCWCINLPKCQKICQQVQKQVSTLVNDA